MKICYVGGCGHLGLSLAAWSAHKGFDVICADLNEEAVECVNCGVSPISEPQVSELIAAHYGKNLRATTNTIEAVWQSDMTFIIVNTPSKDDGSFSLDQILAACKDVGVGMLPMTDYHVVVVVSTVNPGDGEAYIVPALEAASGKKLGGFGYVYAPEFIRQGSIVDDFANPSMVVIGESDVRAGYAAEAYYRAILEDSTPLNRMSIVSAEITKLGLNVAVVAKVNIANSIAMLCHNVPGADVDDVLMAIGDDVRIGHRYLRAGPWVGGPCFPRDCRAMSVAMCEAHTPNKLPMALDGVRRSQIWFVANAILQEQPEVVGILGLTYKPGVSLLMESQGYQLAEVLDRAPSMIIAGVEGPAILMYDPMVPGESDLEGLVAASDLIVLMTCWPEFEALYEMDLSGKTVFDMWGFYDESDLNCEKYVRFGRGPKEN